MEYEGSIGLVTRKMKKKIIADFHVLGLFMTKKHDLSDKENPSVTRSCRRGRCWINLCHAYSLPLES
jgi:hypothetical protein